MYASPGRHTRGGRSEWLRSWLCSRRSHLLLLNLYIFLGISRMLSENGKQDGYVQILLPTFEKKLPWDFRTRKNHQVFNSCFQVTPYPQYCAGLPVCCCRRFLIHLHCWRERRCSPPKKEIPEGNTRCRRKYQMRTNRTWRNTNIQLWYQDTHNLISTIISWYTLWLKLWVKLWYQWYGALRHSRRWSDVQYFDEKKWRPCWTWTPLCTVVENSRQSLARRPETLLQTVLYMRTDLCLTKTFTQRDDFIKPYRYRCQSRNINS